ncbi:hypothetical protein SAMN04488540_102380 [Ferrimonas sediminum]|uniref:Uncharacterized protein n=1 Tax=Ferrimonas sediminum TaxID=718193 RepID=A0A1G8MHC5_9GAMM|nr:hypothetical protein [Ferrimonas sediminum]SDI67324.1 hypothetical protein SAMN04488540_102380 [Ferrimonas sediminum]
MQSVINTLDKNSPSTPRRPKLEDLVKDSGWVNETTAVTQEPDGSLVHWRMPLHQVVAARLSYPAKSLRSELGGSFSKCVVQVAHEKRELAEDWSSGVVSALNFMDCKKRTAW